MPKIVKLPLVLYSEWRENLCHLVDDEGTVSEPISRELETLAEGVARVARSRRREHEQVVIVDGRKHRVVVTMERVGKGPDDFLEEVKIDGLRVVSARDIICAQMLEKHGECQLRHVNGVMLKHIRDPGLKRTTFKESLQVAPRPEHCPCSSWGTKHPGTHHHTCKWNKLAPPEEQAPAPEKTSAPRKFSALANQRTHVVRAPGDVPVVARLDQRAVETLTEKAERNPPESCENGCRSHALPKNAVLEDGQHHPMCPYFDHWKRKAAKSEARWLVDLGTGEKVREATDQEIGEADVAKKRTGSPIVQVDSIPFAVLSASEISEAEAESTDKVVASGERP